jgi:hypothetical protein
MIIAGKTMVVVLFDPVIIDLVRGKAPAKVGFGLKEINLVHARQCMGSNKAGQATPDDADLHKRYL